MKEPAFVEAVSPLVETKIRALPVGSLVLVATVGDAAQVPLLKRARVQLRRTAEGDSAINLAASVRGLLAGFPERLKTKAQTQSDLVAGLFDAARLLDPASHSSQIVMLSDGIEESSVTNCARVKACKLPPPKFSLNGVEVTIYGIGLGMDSARGMALNHAWDTFLKQAGASKTNLLRTF